MSNNNDYSRKSGSSGRGSRSFRELLVDALSTEEWNYLRGLFLADGCSYERPGRYSYHVKFFFQGNETELTRRVVEMVSRLGLRSRVYRDASKDMVTIDILSKSLLSFLPCKMRLLLDEAERKRFFGGNCLYDVKGGIPFLAGLLDGDGACWVCTQRWRFEGLNKWNWNFAQGKYLFLTDYVKEFVESLAVGGLAERVRSNGVVELRFRKAGITSLLHAGIARHSWKVVRWLDKCNKFENKREGYCTARQVARMLGVGIKFVIKRLRDGEIRYERGSVRGSEAGTVYYIPLEEVERYREWFLEDRKRTERVLASGIRRLEGEASSGGSIREQILAVVKDLGGIRPHDLAERLGVSLPDVSKTIRELKKERLVNVARNLPYINSLKKANAIYYLDARRSTALHDTVMNIVWQRNSELGGTSRDYSFEWGGKSWHTDGVLDNDGGKLLLEVVAGGYHDGIIRQLEAYLTQMREDRYLKGIIVVAIESKCLMKLREKALSNSMPIGVKLFITALRSVHEKRQFESLLRHGDANAYHENPTY